MKCKATHAARTAVAEARRAVKRAEAQDLSDRDNAVALREATDNLRSALATLVTTMEAHYASNPVDVQAARRELANALPPAPRPGAPATFASHYRDTASLDELNQTAASIARSRVRSNWFDQMVDTTPATTTTSRTTSRTTPSPETAALAAQLGVSLD